MSVDHVNAELRTGEQAVRRLANATLAFGVLSVDGVLGVAPLADGSIDLQGTRSAFTCVTDDLDGAGPEEDDAVTITRDGVSFPYLVALRTEHPRPGQTVLDLKRAAA